MAARQAKRHQAGIAEVGILHFAIFNSCILQAVGLLFPAVTILGLASIEFFLRRNAAARSPMARWIEVVEEAEWHDITEVRAVLPTADAIKGTNLTCFNIGGNSYRLLTVISYPTQEVYIHELMTHAQYTKKYT
jgi:mRNA interferase HigB